MEVMYSVVGTAIAPPLFEYHNSKVIPRFFCLSHILKSHPEEEYADTVLVPALGTMSTT